jgi:hypothetical protein
MALTILRLATLYGEGDPGNVGRLMRALDRGRFLWIGDGSNRNSAPIPPCNFTLGVTGKPLPHPHSNECGHTKAFIIRNFFQFSNGWFIEAQCQDPFLSE